MRISDWSSDVCSSDLVEERGAGDMGGLELGTGVAGHAGQEQAGVDDPQVWLAQFPLKPVGRYQYVHARPCSLAGSATRTGGEIGRASGRERVGQYGEIPGDA